MSENIVHRLLKGSLAMDRMKTEIDQIVRILIGYLNSLDLVRPENEEGFDENSELHFEEGVFRWIVTRIVNTDAVAIELEIRPWDGCRTVYYSQWGKPNAPSSHDIPMIYQKLPILVDGLAERYPELRKAWEPLFLAADM